MLTVSTMTLLFIIMCDRVICKHFAVLAVVAAVGYESRQNENVTAKTIA